jgi:hypothetical protein
VLLETMAKYESKLMENKKYTTYIKDQINKNDDTVQVRKLCVYTHADIKLIYALIKTDNDGDSNNEFMIALNNTDYLIVGVNNTHPFILTNDFIYDNSDGSGPEYMVKKKYDVNNIITQFQKYYKEFCDNDYH